MPFYGIEGQGWFLRLAAYSKHVNLRFFRGTSLKPEPLVGERERRGLHLREDDELDEEQFASWVRQAAAMPRLPRRMNPASPPPGRPGTRPSALRGQRAAGSPNDRGPDHGLGGEDALQGLQPSRELRDPPGIAVHDKDLQTRLRVEVGMGRGPDEPEELVLAVEEPMRD